MGAPISCRALCVSFQTFPELDRSCLDLEIPQSSRFLMRSSRPDVYTYAVFVDHLPSQPTRYSEKGDRNNRKQKRSSGITGRAGAEPNVHRIERDCDQVDRHMRDRYLLGVLVG